MKKATLLQRDLGNIGRLQQYVQFFAGYVEFLFFFPNMFLINGWLNPWIRDLWIQLIHCILIMLCAQA